jgi:FkbH-like protein
MMSAPKSTLSLTGTYTCNPLADVVDHWTEFLGLELCTELSDYGQLFQQLLNPTSVLRRKRDGANLVALRWEDLCGQNLASLGAAFAWSDIEAHVAEVVSAVLVHDHAVPCLLIVGPSTAGIPALSRATEALRVRLAEAPNVFVACGDEAMARYAVTTIHDAASDRFGHVPFTPEAFAALGTTAARWYASLVRPPVKVFAVDGDHTLWSGVVGEDGADGVRVDGARQKLQATLVEQTERGRLLCLLSKNEQADVRELFARRAEMPLKWSHFTASRNLRTLAGELELGADSFVFLDDNPVECADMRANCSAALTVRVPTEAARLSSFVDHLWLFDQPRVTDEDRNRASMYRDNASRAELRGAAVSLGDFLQRLELVVEFAEPASADVARLAQLTQRTNQFNASQLRCDEADMRRGLSDDACWHRLVRVRDRFGDYGIVGQVRAAARDGCLSADLFMLSCRAPVRARPKRRACGVPRLVRARGN